MKNKEIFQKYLEKIVENGYQHKGWHNKPFLDHYSRNANNKPLLFSVIFDHKAAKAFARYLFIEKRDLIEKQMILPITVRLPMDEDKIEEIKKNLLQRMVIEKEPLKYLKRFIK